MVLVHHRWFVQHCIMAVFMNGSFGNGPLYMAPMSLVHHVCLILQWLIVHVICSIGSSHIVHIAHNHYGSYGIGSSIIDGSYIAFTHHIYIVCSVWILSPWFIIYGSYGIGPLYMAFVALVHHI